jgi:hypothetical protein
MNDSTYLTPRLGGKSLAIATVWVAVCLAPTLSIEPSDAFGGFSWEAMTRLGILFGIGFGLASSLSWVATVLQNRILRVTVRILLVAFFASLLDRFGPGDWIQHSIDLAGLLIVQSIYFSRGRIPDWRMPAGTDSAPIAGPGSEVGGAVGKTGLQYHISDLLALTTGIALLLGLAIRYVVPTEGTFYWFVMFGFWLLLPLVAACAARASLAAAQITTRLHVLSAVWVASLLGVGLWVAERLVQGLEEIAVLYFYLLFFGLFGATVYVFGVAGRAPIADEATLGEAREATAE